MADAGSERRANCSVFFICRIRPCSFIDPLQSATNVTSVAAPLRNLEAGPMLGTSERASAALYPPVDADAAGHCSTAVSGEQAAEVFADAA